MAPIRGEKQASDRTNVFVKSLDEIPLASVRLEDLDSSVSASGSYQNSFGFVNCDICDLACMGPRTKIACTGVSMKGPVQVRPSITIAEIDADLNTPYLSPVTRVVPLENVRTTLSSLIEPSSVPSACSSSTLTVLLHVPS